MQRRMPFDSCLQTLATSQTCLTHGGGPTRPSRTPPPPARQRRRQMTHAHPACLEYIFHYCCSLLAFLSDDGQPNGGGGGGTRLLIRERASAVRRSPLASPAAASSAALNGAKNGRARGRPDVTDRCNTRARARPRPVHMRAILPPNDGFSRIAPWPGPRPNRARPANGGARCGCRQSQVLARLSLETRTALSLKSPALV
jgi:hypothetical protein